MESNDSHVKASVFIGTSLDGFIARKNGAFDFLPPGGGEPHGYDEFMASVDALVIGRNTYETVLAFETWPYDKKPVFRAQYAPACPPARRGCGRASFGRANRDCRASCCAQPASFVRGWRGYHSTLSAGRAGSASYHHACTCSHRRRNTALWPTPSRCPLAPHCHSSVRQRPRPK